MSGVREAILAQLAKKKRKVTAPAPWTSRRSFPDPAARFAESLEKVKGEVHQVENLEAAWRKVGELFDDLSPKQVVSDGGTPVAPEAFRLLFPEVQWHHTAGAAAGDLAGWKKICAGADVGISGADAALAETGTVVLNSGSDRSRLVTLLPPVHLALVPTGHLYTDLFTWIAAREGPLPAAVTLVSGPSKTADIEQTLAVGVHGPKRFIVVLYGLNSNPL